MNLISKTVVRHYGTSEKWPRYRIIREYYWVNDNDEEDGDDTMELLDEIFWTGIDWSDEAEKALLYTNFASAIEDKDKIEENL